ncbi:MAG: DNA polymerase III subunit delta [Campylobacterota bacterium]|nr:DNA polymerase III subunit delta [Campylobacterota bacterium]
MYKRELDQRLQRELPKALLLYGDNAYMIDYYIGYYINKLQAREDLLALYFDEWDFNQAKTYLSQSSLFGGTNLLIVRQDKKLPKKELDSLIEFAKKNSDNYFLLGFSGEAKDAKSMQSSFAEKKGGIWARFFEPNVNEGAEALRQKAQMIGLDIDHYALQHLMLILNNNLALCANELDKLAILGTKITSKDIDQLVYSTAPLATEQFLTELFEKKPVTEMIGTLLEIGEDEASLLRSTQRFVNEIFLFNAYIKLHGAPDSAAILGYKLPKQIEEKKAQLAMKIKPAALLGISEHLLESELEMKRPNGANKETLLYGTYIKMQRYL